jgi:CHRD domain
MTKAELLALSLLGGACTFATAATAQLVQEGGRPFTVQMTGAAERPGPGDPDGSGTAKFMLNNGQGRVCFELTVTGIAPATAAHIHEADVDHPGPIVVPLAAPTDGDSSGCVDVDPEEIKEIIQDPGDYYVNVHNADFPAGAIRGQLAK